MARMWSWSSVVFWLRIGAVLWAVVVAVALILLAHKQLTLSPGLEATAWIVSAIIIGVDNLGTLFRRKANRDLHRFRADIDEAILPMLTQMAETRQVRFEQLGGSVYRPKRQRWFSQKPKVMERLRRVRPSNYPRRNGVTWTASTGQVGASFTVGAPVYQDWHAAGMEWQKHRLRSDADKAFAELDEAIRGKHSYEEFVAAAGRYSEVIAIPLLNPLNDSEVIGVLTIDRAFEEDNLQYAPFLNTQAAERIYAGPQELLASILKPAGSS